MTHVGPSLHISARHEVWPLRDVFTISRGSKSASNVVVVTVTDGHHSGRGEAVPYARYGETVDGVLAAIAALSGIQTRIDLCQHMAPGAALNAVDCALWDFEAKRAGVVAATLAGVATVKPVLTAFTLSLGTPESMAAKARNVAHLPLLKLKLGGDGDHDRMRAVRAARPDARLIADANEGWTADILPDLLKTALELAFETIEQPLPEKADEALRGRRSTIPICADESVHTAADVPRLADLYDAINIKLDKAGGLTGGLALQAAARQAGMKIMIGSMVATSLAVAPAMILAQDADWVDLDGPLLLARDRDHAIQIHNGLMSPPSAKLWG